MAPEPGDLVRSGSFRVDRARALEKLKVYRFADTGDFPVFWLRCAVACGATAASIVWRPTWLELAFDGRPLEEKGFLDPLALLLEEATEENYPARQLGLGLLAMYRSGIDRVVAESGRLSAIFTEKEDQVRVAVRPSAGTILRVEVSKIGLTVEVPKLEEAAGLLPLALTVNGKSLPGLAAPEGRPKLTFEEEGFRGVLWAREEGALDRIALYSRGMLVQQLTRSQGSGVEAHLNCDDFNLDLSQAKVVQDERHAAALKFVTEGTTRLREELLRTQEELHLPRLRSLAADPKAWAAFLAYRDRPTRFGEALLPLVGGPRAGEARLAALWENAEATWLRRLPPETVGGTPLYPTADGGALTAEEMARLSSGGGQPAWRARPGLAQPPLLAPPFGSQHAAGGKKPAPAVFDHAPATFLTPVLILLLASFTFSDSLTAAPGFMRGTAHWPGASVRAAAASLYLLEVVVLFWNCFPWGAPLLGHLLGWFAGIHAALFIGGLAGAGGGLDLALAFAFGVLAKAAQGLSRRWEDPP